MNFINDPTLYSTVVKLNATRDGSLPATHGQQAHGAFFHIIKSVDPALADALHAPNQRRPFTISPLRGIGQARQGQVRVRQGQQVWLRFTLLGSQLFTTFIRHFLWPVTSGSEDPAAPARTASALPTLRLGSLDFAIAELLTTPGSHPWAGYTTVADLSRKWATAELNEASRQISLEFASGTAFSRSSNKDGMGKFMEFLPTPAMLFGSLAAKWNEHTGLELDKEALRTYAEETVVVSAFKLETQLFHYSDNPQIGTAGWITYQLKDTRAPDLGRALNLLADFAFYSGAGTKTAMGMGQVRRISKPAKQRDSEVAKQ